MPVEIRELIIRTTITGGDSGNSTASATPDQNPDMKEEIISECVEQVMRILNERDER
jgi:hypothetical protein